ncbi:MAG: aldo/keto reductase [Pseudonocardiaceae bacterium]|nr:aldo/keto reductase [Pseudonocardiaceae bacterium]
MPKIATTDLDVFPLNLGGNVFGWTADEAQSFTVLDAYTEAGGNFIDTADLYSAGGSETIIGNWLARRGRRDDMVIATKVGMWQGRPGLSAENIRQAAEDSLRRLRTDYVDLYYAHLDDRGTEQDETLGAFDELVRAGKVRYIAASNYSASRLSAALSISESLGLARFVALQPHYNLVERDYERELAPVVAREGLSAFPYFALAKGFLTGKYRPGGDAVDSPRSERARPYLDAHGTSLLPVLDEIAAGRGVSVSAVSLAWLAAQPAVVAPVASARTPEQLADLLPASTLTLSDDELGRLDAATD